jgi:antitoxin YefM
MEKPCMPLNLGLDRRTSKVRPKGADACASVSKDLLWRWQDTRPKTCTISRTATHGMHTMDAITYTSARANLAKTMDRVCDDHEPLIITRSGEQSVVMLALDDFKALEETAYLLRSPTNARRLLAAMQELEAGKGKVRKLVK